MTTRDLHTSDLVHERKGKSDGKVKNWGNFERSGNRVDRLTRNIRKLAGHDRSEHAFLYFPINWI